jgi:hypothetical protein
VKKLDASEKWTAEPPSMRSRSPKGVFTESKAIDPTTVSDTSFLSSWSRFLPAGRRAAARGLPPDGG